MRFLEQQAFFLAVITLLSLAPAAQAQKSAEEEELKSTIASDPAHRKPRPKVLIKKVPATGGEIKVDEAQKRIVTGPIRFATDTADPTPESLLVLKQIATLLLKNNLQVQIQAHTDSLGSDRKNLEISQKRADIVKEILIREGVPAQRLEAIGLGDTRLIASDVTPAGQEKNRRVEFHVVQLPPPPPTPAPEPVPPAPSPVTQPESFPQPTTLPTTPVPTPVSPSTPALPTPYPPTPAPTVPVLPAPTPPVVPSPTPPPTVPSPATPGMVP